MKILMATMGLDIGGAETHIVELSKELKSRGHQVAVVYSPSISFKYLRTDASFPHAAIYNTHIPPRFRIHALFSTLYIGHIFHSFIFRNEMRCFCHQKNS